ncbi:MAG: hypothetical protein V1750_08550, partial [Acidobacteriota bacterium]
MDRPLVKTLLTMALLACFGAVIMRYQAVNSPQPLVTLLLAIVFLALFTLAAFGAGRPVWSWAGGGDRLTAGSLTIVLAAGAGVLMAAAAAASLAGVLHPAVLIALALLAVASGAHGLFRLSFQWRPSLPGALRAPMAILVMAAAVTLPVTTVLSPFYDQFNYHLAFPFQWLQAGHLVVYPRHSYSFLASNMGLLYTYALATVGSWGGQSLHWWMGALATLGAGALAGRLGGPRAGLWAGAIFAATPAVLVPATWAGADLGVAAFAAAA